MGRAPHLVSILALVLLLGLALPGYAQDKEIFLFNGTSMRQITNDSDDDEQPQINDAGGVVWKSEDNVGSELDSEIFSFNGVSAARLTRDHDRLDESPKIGTDGAVAWQSAHYLWDDDNFEVLGIEILVYDGESTTVISGSEWALEPLITDSGNIVWGGMMLAAGGNQIFVHDGSTVTEIFEPGTFVGYSSYAASNYGVAAGGIVDPVTYSAAEAEIWVYDGTAVTQLTDNDYLDHEPSINNDGQVAWLAKPPDGDDAEVFLFDGASVVRLTDNDLEEVRPEINEQGKVVWSTAYSAEPGLDSEIFLYDGSTVIQITDNDVSDFGHQINDTGTVVWSGGDGTDHEIFLYEGGEVTQLTDNEFDDDSPQINASGQVTWVGEPADPPPPDPWAAASTLDTRQVQSQSGAAAWVVLLALPLLVSLVMRRRNRTDLHAR